MFDEKDIAEAFSGDLEIVGNNEPRLVQSENEKRVRLMTGKSELIDLAAQKIQEKMASLSDVVYVYQYVLTRISSKRVADSGKILDGAVDFSLTIGSFRSRRKSRIAVSFPVIEGLLRDTNQFETTTGAAHLFTKEAVKKVMGVKDSDTRIMKSRESFMRTMQWSANFNN